MLLQDTVAFISGVGPGMGRDVALLFADHGADVVLGARTLTKVEAVAAEVEGRGRRALPLVLDIADAQSCRQAVDAAKGMFGGIDVLVNVAFFQGDFRAFDRADLSTWRHTMDVNFFGTLQLTQLVAAEMKKQGSGRIVMINSISALDMEAKLGAYAASKSALATATKTLALELGRHGIRVNGVHPGAIWGEGLKQHLEVVADAQGTTFEAKLAELEATTCLGYVPHSSEIAGTVLFLASDLAKPVTGQAIGVNAGQWFQGF
jgi:NAD(P)-dependent dehydrogenase (short-subunit alcohol dehydrogenase family)